MNELGRGVIAPDCFAVLCPKQTDGMTDPSGTLGGFLMTERFISFYPMAYPPCRLDFVNNPKGASKACFTTIDDEILNDEERFRQRITYITSNGKIKKVIDIFHEGECTNNSCTLQGKVLCCRFSIEDLSDEEIVIFKQKSDINNYPDFVLQSGTEIPLDTFDKRYEHQEAINRSEEQFASYYCNPRYDTHGKYMQKLIRIAKTIRAANGRKKLKSAADTSKGPIAVRDEFAVKAIKESAAAIKRELRSLKPVNHQSLVELVKTLPPLQHEKEDEHWILQKTVAKETGLDLSYLKVQRQRGKTYTYNGIRYGQDKDGRIWCKRAVITGEPKSRKIFYLKSSLSDNN